MNIFISYRRDDSSGYAGRLFDRLSAHFGRPNVFMDIEALEPGADFVEGIDRAMASCEALVVLIGTEWLSATDAKGRRRLDNPNDFIRLEVANALQRELLVLPVLVNDATMPTEEELPPPLAPLARRQAHELSNTRWEYDVGRLIDVLERRLAKARQVRPSAAETPADVDRPPVREDAGSPAQTAHVRRSGAGTWIWPILAVGLLGLLGLVAWLAVTRLAGPPPQQVPAPPPEQTAQPVPEPSPEAPPLQPVVETPPERPEPPPEAPVEPAAPPDPATQIEALLVQAAADFEANRLTRPAGANAYLRYQQILELAPGHPEALEGLRRLGHRYVDLASLALEGGRRDQAHAYLDQAERFIPAAPELAELRGLLASPPAPPPAAEDPARRERCLEACEARLAACREKTETESGDRVQTCLHELRERCEIQYDECSNDPQRLLIWGAVATGSACAGEHQRCMRAGEAACHEALKRSLSDCEAQAEECRRACRTP